MCLITDKQVQVAQTDITVYKLLHARGDYKAVSIFQGFIYLLGETYSTPLGPDTYTITSYDHRDSAALSKKYPGWRHDTFEELQKRGLTVYAQGFHSYVEIGKWMGI